MKKSVQNPKTEQTISPVSKKPDDSASVKHAYQEGSLTHSLAKSVLEAVKVTYSDIQIGLEEIELEHPTLEEHGDYATNVALRLSKRVGTPPIEIAKNLINKINEINKISDQNKENILEKVEIAGPGFINFFLVREVLCREVERIILGKEKYGLGKIYSVKKFMVEFAHPNTHKEMHIGHMRTLITGEALTRILEHSSAKVFRANYQGDIGPHVAKAIWGTQKILDGEGKSWEVAEKMSDKDKAHLLGQGYILGNKEYEANKEEIDSLNKCLYIKDPSVQAVYDRTRKWSLDYYNSFYARFYTKFDRLYFEYEVAGPGKKIVQENIGKVFKESDGAVVFEGEPFGLHTRVFITRDGNPTYEGKEMALAPLEYSDFPFDTCIHVVASEQAGYFQVVIKALELVDPKFVGKEYHLSMGMVQLVGRKISSRTGVIITVDGLLDDVKELLKEKLHDSGLSDEEKQEVLEAATVGAIKYSVLKSGPLLNATFDLEKSVSLDGDSGPYLQYTYARARSILRKAQTVYRLPSTDYSNRKKTVVGSQWSVDQLQNEELALLKYLYRFPEVVEAAARTYSPNLLCTYLYELAKRFNNFYNNVQILGASSQQLAASRIQLTEATSIVLKNGLNLLGIKALERM